MYVLSHSGTGLSSGEPIFVSRLGSVIHHRPFIFLKVLPDLQGRKSSSADWGIARVTQ